MSVWRPKGDEIAKAKAAQAEAAEKVYRHIREDGGRDYKAIKRELDRVKQTRAEARKAEKKAREQANRETWGRKRGK